MIEVYTDGACSGNPGPGGWGAVILHPSGHQQHMSGAEAKSTNNRMEMRAAIEALNYLPEGSEVRVTTDSEYVMKGMTEWIKGWIKNDWKNRHGKPVKNKEQWLELLGATKRHRSVAWAWVRGHRGHRENELADSLAVEAISRLESCTDEAATLMVSQVEQPEGSTVNMHQVSAENDFRVIRTDNYESKAPVEYFVGQRLTMDQARAVARTLNDIQDADSPDYYKVVSHDYQMASPQP